MPEQRFKHVRVKIERQYDASDVIISCEKALRTNGVTQDEMEQFRRQCIAADDPMDVAREWVDPY